jgi:hypothetical protein
MSDKAFLRIILKFLLSDRQNSYGVKNAIDLITNRLNETDNSSNQIEMFDLNSD